MIELEKKWLLKEVVDLEQHGMTLLKKETFVQTYLSKHERLRAVASTLTEEVEYQHFTKKPIGEGQSVEDLTIIPHERYLELLFQGTCDVVKGRSTFLDEASGLKYEVDYLHFEFPLVDIGLLEIEFQDRYKDMKEVNENFVLPEFMNEYVLMDVTGNNNFSNYHLAKRRDTNVIEEG